MWPTVSVEAQSGLPASHRDTPAREGAGGQIGRWEVAVREVLCQGMSNVNEAVDAIGRVVGTGSIITETRDSCLCRCACLLYCGGGSGRESRVDFDDTPIRHHSWTRAVACVVAPGGRVPRTRLPIGGNGSWHPSARPVDSGVPICPCGQGRRSFVRGVAVPWSRSWLCHVASTR
jgi:hypothetical protein